MILQAIPRLDDGGGSPFSRDGMASHGIHLGYDGHAKFGVDLRNGDGGPQACSATTNQKNIMRRAVYDFSLLSRTDF